MLSTRCVRAWVSNSGLSEADSKCCTKCQTERYILSSCARRQYSKDLGDVQKSKLASASSKRKESGTLYSNTDILIRASEWATDRNYIIES